MVYMVFSYGLGDIGDKILRKVQTWQKSKAFSKLK